MSKNTSGFSIIEVLIGILIFSLGLVAVYALISSSLRLNDYNKNFIIASNLAREQLELIKNIRDTNYETIHKWDEINPNGDYNDISNYFKSGMYYTIENDFRPLAPFSVKVRELANFGEGPTLLTTKMVNYRLCIDSENMYTYNCGAGTRKSYFYRYLKIDDVKYLSGGTVYKQKDAYKVTSKVIWYMHGYHETQLDTVLTDWKRL